MKKKLVRIGWIPYCTTGHGNRGFWKRNISRHKKEVFDVVGLYSYLDFEILPVYAEVPRK